MKTAGPCMLVGRSRERRLSGALGQNTSQNVCGTQRERLEKAKEPSDREVGFDLTEEK